MKRCVFLAIYILMYQVSIAQENGENFDFIICIDEEIVSSVGRSAIIVKQGDSIIKKIDVRYHPGNLLLISEDCDMIFSKKEVTILLQFDHYQYPSNKKEKVTNYEIEMGRSWFEQLYVILKIYNLDKRKYRKSFEPLSKDRNYTYDLDTSQGQMKRIRKR